jgi:RNA polymerase sigma-70 factor (TIGR02960 family)
MSSGVRRRFKDMTESDFAALVEPHRRELHVHCYRMLGSFEEAEDHVQETLLRAWRSRNGLAGDGNLRAWLYKIATNACLDTLRSRSRKPVDSYADLPFLQPYPDRLLDEVEQPDAVVEARETIELAYIAMMQLLPARQRAALILREVLGWSAKETADLLDTSVASVNSALQRPRATLDAERPDRGKARTTGDLGETEQRLLAGFIDAHERADPAAAAALVSEDIRITMPPHPFFYEGVDQIRPLISDGLTGPGEWRLVTTSANRMPAAACYLREYGATEFRAFKIDVVRIEGGKVAEITTFDATLFPQFGLPPTLAG